MVTTRYEGEVGYGAVARGEEDHVCSGGDLPGDALQVVARAVHEVEPALAHPLGVIYDVVDAYVRVFLPRGADGLYGDVVEPAVIVPAGGLSQPCGRASLPAP